MSYRLFVDDERFPATSIENDAYRADVGLPPLSASRLRQEQGPWVIARSTASALATIGDLGLPTFIAFDHDLGDSVPTGHDLAKALVELDLDGVIDMPIDLVFEVHSANPVGRANIKGILDNYLEVKARRQAAP